MTTSEGVEMPVDYKRVTIGIPSYNEEENISNLIRSIIEINKLVSQSAKHGDDDSHGDDENDSNRSKNNGIDSTKDFVITEIIISDDSSDRTCSILEGIAAEYSSVDIKLLHHDIRRGVSTAWNEIFEEAKGDIIVLYDADIKIDSNTTAYLVESIRDGIGLCASNTKPIALKKSTVSRASIFIAEWLRWVRKNRLSQYTVMGRALSFSSHVAKMIKIPEDVIALDLYLQCKVLELGFNVFYNDQAQVYFRAPDNMVDFSSQVIRATIGHRQIQNIQTRSCARLPFRTGMVAALKSIMRDPRGAVSLIYCYSLLPLYWTRLRDVDSAKWHVAKSTKRLA
jgi:cellulose synthase/poly-beta-1,6-N-acetylglucosamine synthase-like glycosyltransferase